ncbi:glycosyltransferase family 2 protein [Desertivirga arenae]|uniref:glycosyltransferase family 2 protein n=1 Tax=Desertivirga arenae TaxID=2810309 RepID=UPI001A971B5E|nr:glycosyltransferase family 2 protein [Pedobacter sp. SYSU D00823]
MNNSKFRVSVVIPIFNEEGNVAKIVDALYEILNRYSDFEILFVNDGSTDGTLQVLRAISSEKNQIKYLSFSRNFGHQNALKAGLDNAEGDCIISMDGDLQHPPHLIPSLIEKWLEGYDVVYTLRKEDPRLGFFKRWSANLFYKTINSLSDISIEKGSADFRLISKAVNEVIRTLPENPIFFRGMIKWLGFKQIGIEYMPEERLWGKSKYSLSKMFKFAIIGVTGFSIKPLHLSTLIGSFLSFFSFCYGLYAIAAYFFSNATVSGWTSILALIAFIGGVQLLMMGIIGEYLGKLFIASKQRPQYIIAEKKL